MLEEVQISCPYCAAPITVLADLSVAEQTYIEDCAVCCQPMLIRCECDDGVLTSLEARRSDD